MVSDCGMKIIYVSADQPRVLEMEGRRLRKFRWLRLRFEYRRYFYLIPMTGHMPWRQWEWRLPFDATERKGEPQSVPYANCDSTGWVCENHADKPWKGASLRADAYQCGAGMPCNSCKSI